MTKFNESINFNVLVESDEKSFNSVKNIVEIMYQLGNKPSTSDEMADVYERIIRNKLNKKITQEALKDKASPIRANLGSWSNIARIYKIASHEPNKDGCTNPNKHHRMCSKSAKTGTRGKLYWIESEIAKKLFIQPFPKEFVTTVYNNKRKMTQEPVVAMPEKKQKLFGMASFESQHISANEFEKIISTPLTLEMPTSQENQMAQDFFIQEIENLFNLPNDLNFATQDNLTFDDIFKDIVNSTEKTENVDFLNSDWLNVQSENSEFFIEDILSMPFVF